MTLLLTILSIKGLLKIAIKKVIKANQGSCYFLIIIMFIYSFLIFPLVQGSVIKMLFLYYFCKTIAGNNRLNKVWKKVCTLAALAN